MSWKKSIGESLSGMNSGDAQKPHSYAIFFNLKTTF